MGALLLFLNNEVRRKHIKPYYHRHPSMYKFQELMNKSNKRDVFRLMISIKIAMKDYDSTMQPRNMLFMLPNF